MYKSDMHGSRIVSGGGGGGGGVGGGGGEGAPPDLSGSILGGSSLRPGVFL